MTDARSRVAVAHRRRDPAPVSEARRNHAAGKLAAHVRQALATAPPLTEQQRREIARLLT